MLSANLLGFVEGDTLPELAAVYTGVDLTGYQAIELRIKYLPTQLIKAATVTNAAGGAFKFTWTAGDLRRGMWAAEIKLTDASGKVITFDDLAFDVHPHVSTSPAPGSNAATPLTLVRDNLTLTIGAMPVAVFNLASTTPTAVGTLAGAVGTSTTAARADHAHGVTDVDLGGRGLYGSGLTDANGLLKYFPAQKAIALGMRADSPSTGRGVVLGMFGNSFGVDGNYTHLSGLQILEFGDIGLCGNSANLANINTVDAVNNDTTFMLGGGATLKRGAALVFYNNGRFAGETFDMAASANEQQLAHFATGVNQTGTASYDLIFGEVHESSVGSGYHRLLSLGINSGTSNYMAGVNIGNGTDIGGYTPQFIVETGGNVLHSVAAHEKWSSTASASGVADVGLQRSSPGALKVTNGSTGLGGLVSTTLWGDTASAGALTLMSTTHATKGLIKLGTSAYDEANNRLGVGTQAPTHGLTIANGAQWSHYNTAVSGSNYERVTGFWVSNIYVIQAQAGGSGTSRQIEVITNDASGILITDGGLVQLRGASGNYGAFQTLNDGDGMDIAGKITTLNQPTIRMRNAASGGGLSSSNGLQQMLQILGTVAQTGTGAYTGLEVNITESSTGSGNKRLIDCLVGSSSKFSVRNDGRLTFIAANEQTTIGAAGGASALPATPTKYLKIVDSAGTTLVVPAYAAS